MEINKNEERNSCSGRASDAPSVLRPVFIIGAQRSGTTLLRLMLNAHPAYCVPEESTFLMPLLRKIKSGKSTFSPAEFESFLSYLRKNSQFALWGITVENLDKKFRCVSRIDITECITFLFNEYCLLEQKSGWADKTPSYFRMVDVLSKIFPTAKFIHIVRDGRDLYLSWKKMDPTKSNPAVMAKEWCYKVNLATKLLNECASDRYMEIRYEDLARDSAGILNSLCEFLAIEYTEKMLEYWKKSESYIGKHHSKLIFTGVSDTSIDKWKTSSLVEQRDIQVFEIFAVKVLMEKGYVVELSKVSHLFFVKAYWTLLLGLPLRAFQVFKTKIVLDLSAKFGLRTKASGGEQ